MGKGVGGGSNEKKINLLFKVGLKLSFTLFLFFSFLHPIGPLSKI